MSVESLRLHIVQHVIPFHLHFVRILEDEDQQGVRKLWCESLAALVVFDRYESPYRSWNGCLGLIGKVH
jgi:hypothetical protein